MYFFFFFFIGSSTLNSLSPWFLCLFIFPIQVLLKSLLIKYLLFFAISTFDHDFLQMFLFLLNLFCVRVCVLCFYFIFSLSFLHSLFVITARCSTLSMFANENKFHKAVAYSNIRINKN